MTLVQRPVRQGSGVRSQPDPPEAEEITRAEIERQLVGLVQDLVEVIQGMELRLRLLEAKR